MGSEGWSSMRRRGSIGKAVGALLAILTVSCHGADAQESLWEGVHMASFADAGDFPTLRALGINVVLLNISHDPATWEKRYNAAVTNDLRLIPMLWGTEQTAWQWNQGSAEWELDRKKYPNSIGAKFLDFLRDNPRYFAATFALYSFHEPQNTESKVLVTPERMKKFWRQVHDEKFPAGRLKVYGESIAWHRNCRSGCVDYDGLGLYPFVTAAGRPQYRPLHLRERTGAAAPEIWPEPPMPGRERAMEIDRAAISTYAGWLQDAPAAPDGTRTKLIIAIQTYAAQGFKDIYNRMPTAEEIEAWGKEVVNARKTLIAGVNWYCFRPAARHYAHCLQQDRYDDGNHDRWKAISSVGNLLLSPEARTPTRHPPPKPN